MSYLSAILGLHATFLQHMQKTTKLQTRLDASTSCNVGKIEGNVSRILLNASKPGKVIN